jgi:cyclohexadienyl dehydratase
MKYFQALCFGVFKHPLQRQAVKVVFHGALVALGVFFSWQALANTSRLERVLAAKELRACIWTEYYSISYRNPKTRELSGIDIAITQELARELGVKIKYVESNFAQLYESLEKIDVTSQPMRLASRPSAKRACSFLSPISKAACLPLP